MEVHLTPISIDEPIGLFSIPASVNNGYKKMELFSHRSGGFYLQMLTEVF